MKYLKIFTDFIEIAEPLSDEERGRLFMAMLAYAQDGSLPALPGNERFVWAQARQQIDREAAAYRTKVEASREAGRRSGEVRRRLRQERNERTLPPFNETNQDNDKDNDNDKDKDDERESLPPAAGAARAPAMPPSLEEIESYCRERGNRVDPRRFLDFYTANGWRVGRNPMRDWRAAVRSWESNGVENERAAPQPLTDRELFQQAIELHRMKEAKSV